LQLSFLLLARKCICTASGSHTVSIVQEAVGEAAIKEAHEKKWREAAERTFVQVRDRRLAEASQQVESLINNMNMKLNAMTADSSTDAKTISDALSTFLAEYSTKAGGATKWERLVEFLQSTMQARAWPASPPRSATLRLVGHC
jgi:hypothetical protein